jgi:uncharacterized protein (TIRG00374 family)
MNRPWLKRSLSLLFALGGAFALHLILRDFGYNTIYNQAQLLGWAALPVIGSFLLLFIFLALGWWVLLEGNYVYLFFITLVANAWNNIGPVSKSLGEPTRVYILSRRMSVREAMSTMFVFNIAQAMGTGLTFGAGSLLAPFLFPLRGAALGVCIASAFVTLGGLSLLIYWMGKKRGQKERTRGRRLRALRHWLRWTAHQIRRYAKLHPSRFGVAVVFCAIARLLEGLAFFVIFRALGSPLTVLESVAVDIGRGIADNAFFFVPYQLGTREFSIRFITESILAKGGDVAMTASLIFRLGEVFWIVFGFLVGLWMLRARDVERET